MKPGANVVNVMLVEVPKVTDWIQAWTGVATAAVSTGALVFTGLLLRHEMKVAREERRRVAAERQDAEAAQARTVTAVVKLAHGRVVEVEVTNDSDEPITSVEIDLRETDPSKPEPRYDVDRSDTLLVRMQARSSVVATLVFHQQRDLPTSAVTSIRFTDSRGFTWARLNNQQPVRVFAGQDVARAAASAWRPKARARRASGHGAAPPAPP